MKALTDWGRQVASGDEDTSTYETQGPRGMEWWLGFAIAVAASVFVAWNLRPGLWFTDTTPTGGDFGAHVWAPAYLRDHLLPQLRLTGWTHDWYAGFPAFRFYMVVTSLAVVALNAGFSIGVATWAYVAGGIAAVASIWFFWRGHGGRLGARLLACGIGGLAVPAASALVLQTDETRLAVALILWPATAGLVAHRLTLARSRTWRATITTAAIVLAVLVLPMPYGVSLKLLLIAGSVAMPVAAWAMTRLAGASNEAAGLAAVGACLFLFDSSFNIYGGNLLSTMAGEYAYSLAVAVALIFIGVAAKGMTSGNYRFLAGLLLALVGLTHLIVAFFALAVLAALLIAGPWDIVSWKLRLRWTAVVGCFAAGLSLWWVLPFWWHRGLLTDMGWGKDTHYLSALWSRTLFLFGGLSNFPTLQVFVVIAIASAAVLLLRRSHLGSALVLVGVVAAAAFILLPENRLWNTRLLPFYYIAVYLVAAIGVGELIASARIAVKNRVHRLSEQAHEDEFRTQPPADLLSNIVSIAVVGVLAASVFVVLGLPARSLPGGLHDSVTYEYRWGPFRNETPHMAPGWAEYNLAGYETRPSTTGSGGWDEYSAAIEGMDQIGRTIGCGQALWEYDDQRLGGYGTPMAMMLLPHWTDRCIGSLEGLYFESSATTPYNFLTAAEISARPSNAQRGLPYPELDLWTGTDHMQLLGIKYYMAFSQEALAEARNVPDLREIGPIDNTPWVIFEVLNSQPIVGLSRLPVVVEDWDTSEDGWLLLSAAAFLANDEQPLLLVADGPDTWPRVKAPKADDVAHENHFVVRADQIQQLQNEISDMMPHVSVDPTTITGIERDAHTIRFTVDRIGGPVLIKTSYFPNWEVSGADGPWRISPNFMVVIPTSHHISLYYSRGLVETVAVILGVFLVLVTTVALRLSRNRPLLM